MGRAGDNDSSEYTAIRPFLGTSSGFQSWQYRAIEFILGNKNPDMLKPHEQRARSRRCGPRSRRLRCTTRRSACLRDAASDRAGDPRRDVAGPYVVDSSVEPAWLSVYRAPREHWDLYELAEELVDLEDAFRLWRFRHVTTVERIIGFKPGTGGTSGVAYLKKMLDVVLFPELWKVRTDL